MKKELPPSLRTWFVIHFALDYIVGIPLLLFPNWALGLFGFQESVLTARLVGAALLGIGGVSLVAHKKDKKVYSTLLSLKLIWSGAAIVGILLSILEGTPKVAWVFLAVFVFFFLLWGYYERKL